jgi:hypothetical protein
MSPGATATSVLRKRSTPAKAASVCSTSGRPATGRYCLGKAASPCAPAPARAPVPAHGSSAQKLQGAGASCGLGEDTGHKPGEEKTSVMGAF